MSSSPLSSPVHVRSRLPLPAAAYRLSPSYLVPRSKLDNSGYAAAANQGDAEYATVDDPGGAPSYATFNDLPVATASHPAPNDASRATLADTNCANDYHYHSISEVDYTEPPGGGSGGGGGGGLPGGGGGPVGSCQVPLVGPTLYTSTQDNTYAEAGGDDHAAAGEQRHASATVGAEVHARGGSVRSLAGFDNGATNT